MSFYVFITATVSCLFELVIPTISKFITDRISGESKSDRSLREELIDVKHRMSQISMVDEFAKFAKLQRRYNKLETELLSKVNTSMMYRTKLRLALTWGMKMFNGITIAVLLYFHRNEAVAILPKDSLWPFHGIMSWPCPLENSISLPTWLITSRLAISSLK